MENIGNGKKCEKKSEPEQENSGCFSSRDCFVINPLEHCDDNNIPDVGYPDSEGDDMMDQQNDLSNVSAGRSVRNFLSPRGVTGIYEFVLQAQRRWSLNFSRNKKYIYQKTINFMPSRRLRSKCLIDSNLVTPYHDK